MKVRTRMAPSPTGEYHVGHIATLLKNYAFAKRHGGQFVLRIEDTDQERLVPGAVEKILRVIKAYGLSWDEGPDSGGPFAPYTQSERLATYHQCAQQLVDANKAYYCFCSKERLETLKADRIANHQQPRYDGLCRSLTKAEVATRLAAGQTSVIRLKVPVDEVITFTDLLRGKIEVNSKDIDDQVLLKSDNFPTYHLGVVVDDHLMEITHIMRGEEWISSTPKHALIYAAFGWEQPIYAHLPVFLNPNGKGKMSKRTGAVSAQSFLDAGYLPEAMLNFFMILGWSPKDQREILTLDEYVAEFDPQDISSKSAVFDLKKLAWINGMYIRRLSNEQLLARLQLFLPSDYPAARVASLLPLIKERLVTLKDVEPLLSFFFREVTIDVDQLLATNPELIKQQVNLTLKTLNVLPEWTVESLETVLRSLVEQYHWQSKQYFMLLRLLTTGETATPPLFDTLCALGRERVIPRVSILQPRP